MHPDTINYLQSLDAVRERCHDVLNLAKSNAITSFTLNLSQLPQVVNLVTKLIQRDYTNPKLVPPHSRWRHYEMDQIDRLNNLLDVFNMDKIDIVEQTRRILDLIVISVLLDAGAGNDWKYFDKSTGKTYSRSEGLALAALDMFISGTFSSNVNNSYQVDAFALQNLQVDQLVSGFQVSSSNVIVGLEGRCQLLSNLGGILNSLEYYHGSPYSRPGNIVDYIQKYMNKDKEIDLKYIWTAIQALKPIWPSRITLDQVPLGDVWRCESLPKGSQLVPLHKLSQWLTYSLMEPIERIMKIRIMNKHKLTGLAEYRNGGLFIDMGVIQLTESAKQRGILSTGSESIRLYEPDDAVIIEWRALTVALLDEVGQLVRKQLGLTETEMELAKVLEGGTWKAGREIAASLRPITKGPPINIISDGTVF